MADTLIIDTHGGISGITDFYIEVKPGITFTIDSGQFGKEKYVCVAYEKEPNRQCYKCAFCHNINLCKHFGCDGRYRGDKKMVKFKYVKD